MISLVMICLALMFLFIPISIFTVGVKASNANMKNEDTEKGIRIENASQDFHVIKRYLHALLNHKNIKIEREELLGIFIMARYFNYKKEETLNYFLYHGKNKTAVKEDEYKTYEKLVEDILFIMQIKPDVNEEEKRICITAEYTNKVFGRISSNPTLLTFLSNFSDHKCPMKMKNLKEMVFYDCSEYKDILNYKPDTSKDITFLDIFLYKFLNLTEN